MTPPASQFPYLAFSANAMADGREDELPLQGWRIQGRTFGFGFGAGLGHVIAPPLN